MTVILVLFCAAIAASGQDESTLAVHINPWGFTRPLLPEIDLPIGTYSAGAEYLVTVRHGLMAEALFVHQEDVMSFGIGLHYRFHPEPIPDSFFVGPHLKYFYNLGQIVKDSSSLDFTAHAVILGGSIGHRWLLGPSLAVGMRLGYGYAVLIIDTDSDNPVVDSNIDQVLRRPLAMDGEISIGWIF